MANKKISELESRASLSLSDLMAVGDPSTGYLYKTTISDLKTLTGAGVVSFNGRFGTVNPAEGDYTLTQLGDVIITSATNGQVLQYNGSNWVNTTLPAEADTLDSVTGRGNTTANSITVGSVTAAGLSNLLGQIRTFATTGNTYIGANPGSATDAGFKLDVLGTTRLNGNTTVTGVLTGSDTIRSTNGTVTISMTYGSIQGIIGTISNHSLEIRTNNVYRVGVSTAGVVNIANLIGTGSRMVVADSAGNLSTQAIPDLSGYLPLSGGTLTGGLIGTTGSFASSGSGDTFAINHSSGSGIALNITKGGNGEGLYINKTGGSGNAATIIGTLNATTLVKSGGTSSQFLKADGSVDSNTYATDSSVVHISGTETITGAKTFSNVTTFNQNIVGGIIKLSQGVLLSKSAAVGTDAGFLSLIATSATGLNYINIADGDAPSNTQRFAIPNTGTYTYTFPAASGTLALTSDIPSVAGVYLPLAGGTLTGGLVGTTASFSSTITAQSSGGSGLRVYGGSGTNQWDIYLNSTNLRFSDNTGGGRVVFDTTIQTPLAYVTSSAASVLLNRTGGTTFGAGVQYQTSGTNNWILGTGQTTVGTDFQLYNYGTGSGAFAISYTTNAATFSSSVTAGGDVSAYSLLVNRSVSRNMLGISSTSLPTGGDEEGVVVIKTNHSIWQQSIVGYAVDSKGLRVYNTGGSSYTSFEVAQGNGTKLIVTGSGNVGIGIATPAGAHMLQIHNPTQNYVRMNMTNTATGTSNSDGLIFQQEVGNSIIKNQENGYLAFGVNGAENNLVIAQGGNIGINTTNPYARLTINDGTNINLGIKFGQTDSSAVMLNAYNDAVNANIPMEFRASKYNFSNGNVGINTTNPTEKLDVNGASIIRGALTIAGPSPLKYKYSDNVDYFGIGYISGADYGFYNYNYGRTDLIFTQNSGAATFANSIKTSAPSGGTAKPWKLGEDTGTLYTATRTIKVEIDGSIYYLLAVKSSDL